MKIKIGADELILWLRKNGVAVNIGNKELGAKIRELICDKLGGKKLAKEDCYWITDNEDEIIGEYKLSQRAMQYELAVDKVSTVYKEISTW
ncbi:hypothetical protein MWH28_09655 [Natroniella sulfidigena]|uniref:hypothetical protein n=1 Tax=Natroniella sulfidigena TaxID=723921 RepID=UPI00200B1803|nr:hypothetical protein [Natroniella sulfidigena]MCK8817622.1 hypothetical protein [Natroniella sulfidigena]